MKRNFQLTALAFALAATSGMAMADVFSIVDTDDTLSGNVFNTYTINTDGLNSVTANTITSNGNVSAAGTVTGASLTDGTATMTGGTLSSSNSLGITSTFNNVNISAGNDASVSAQSSVNLVVDSNDGGFGAFTVVKGVAAPVTLITSDVGATQIATQDGTFLSIANGAILNTNATVTTSADINATNVNATGAVTGATVSSTGDVNAAGNVTASGNIATVGTVQGNILTDGTAKLTGGNLTGVNNLTTTNATIDNLTVKNGLTIITSATAPVPGIPVIQTTAPATTQVYLSTNSGNPTGSDVYAIYDAVSSGYNYYTASGAFGTPGQTYTQISDPAEIAALRASLPVTGDYTGQTQNTTNTTTNSTKAFSVNSTQTAYSNTTTKDTKVTIDAGGKVVNTTDPLARPVDGTGAVSSVNVSDKSVITGILVDASGNPLTDAYGNALGTSTDPVYGTRATVTKPSTSPSATAGQTVTSTSVLSGDGLTVTYNDQDPVVATTTVDNNGFSSTKRVTDTTGKVTGDHTVNLKNDGSGLVVTDNQTGTSTLITSTGITTGNVTAASITLAGTDLATTLATEATTREKADVALNGRVDQEVSDREAGDAATLASANATTATTATAVRTEFAAADTAIRNAATAETARVNSAISTGDAATLASANQTTADTATAIRSEATAEKTRVNGELANATTDRAAIRTEFSAADTEIRKEAAAETVRVNSAISTGDAATLASANQNTADTAVAIRSEAATETARVNSAISTGDAATLASANATTATTATAVRTEFAAADTAIRNAATAETARVNSAISTGDASTLASSKAYTDTSSATTLAAANSYTDNRANQMNHRLDDVEKTAYRGVAIALAAQQAIPNLKPGNFAVYGGVGHYEGENAGALGVATLLGNGRTSINAAFGFASSQVGGRIGVSYVFGD